MTVGRTGGARTCRVVVPVRAVAGRAVATACSRAGHERCRRDARLRPADPRTRPRTVWDRTRPEPAARGLPWDVAQTSWWRAALRPRMLGLLVVLLAAAAVCARLGVWQLERAEIRGASAEERRLAQIADAPPEDLAAVLPAGASFTGDMVARKVEATGTYDVAGQLLVTGRAHDGSTDGVLVVAPLHVDGPDGEVVLPVVRGWLDAGAEIPPAPGGEVRVVGWLQAGEEAGTPVVDGSTDAISPAQLAATWGGRLLTGYLVLQTADPADAAQLEPLDPPTRAGTGLNVQNLAYAAQWWIFGAFAVALWVRLVRDEAAGPVALPGDAPAAGPDPDGAPDPDPATSTDRDDGRGTARPTVSA